MNGTDVVNAFATALQPAAKELILQTRHCGVLLLGFSTVVAYVGAVVVGRCLRAAKRLNDIGHASDAEGRRIEAQVIGLVMFLVVISMAYYGARALFCPLVSILDMVRGK